MIRGNFGLSNAVLEKPVQRPWGNPKHLIQKCHYANTMAGVQVGSSDGAKSVKDSGADFIICQGVEAGGHVQSTTPLMRLLDDVVLSCPDVSLVAAGGLVDGADIAKALNDIPSLSELLPKMRPT